MQINITVAKTELSVVIKSERPRRGLDQDSACWRAEFLLSELEDLTDFAELESD